MTAQTSCDVAIVGAGPVGMITALLIRKNGHHVKLFERHSKRYPVPRAVAVFHQGLRTLHALGLYDTLRNCEALAPYAVDPNTFQYVSDGEILAELHAFRPTSKSGLPFALGIHQPSVDAILETACIERGIEIHRSREVTDVIDHGTHVEVVHGAYDAHNSERNGHSEATTASFVVGCDGGNSSVRQAIGINNHMHMPAMSRWLVIDVVPKDIAQSLKWRDTDIPKQYLGPGRPLTVVPSPAKRRRWEFMLYENETTEAASQDAFIWDLLAEFGPAPTNATIERKTVYSPQGTWAESFAKGRVALAGDAAHQAPQFLGQGLNSGLRDAANIAWRISLALKNNKEVDSNRLLQHYSAEQKPVTEIFVTMAKGIEASLIEQDPGAIAARNAAMKKNGIPPMIDLERVAGPGTHAGEGEQLPEEEDAPGRLFIQGQVQNPSGQSDLLDQFLGIGWTLYVSQDTAAKDGEFLSPQTLEKYTKLLGGRSVTFGKDFEDVGEVYGQWFKETGNFAVLVRPDFYIFGCTKDRAGIDGLVQLAVEKIAI